MIGKTLIDFDLCSYKNSLPSALTQVKMYWNAN